MTAIEADRLPLLDVTTAQNRAAARLATRHARDPVEAEMFLQALGLAPYEGRDNSNGKTSRVTREGAL